MGVIGSCYMSVWPKIPRQRAGTNRQLSVCSFGQPIVSSSVHKAIYRGNRARQAGVASPAKEGALLSPIFSSDSSLSALFPGLFDRRFLRCRSGKWQERAGSR
jgi:hypothetical protein